MRSVDEQVRDILKREGGYVDHKADRGGATNHGISLRYAKGKPELDLDGDGDIDKHDIMLVTPELAAKLYKHDFFYGPRIDWLPEGLHPQLFDLSVNAGGRRSVKTLQKALRSLGYPIVADGYVGPATCGAAESAIAKHGLATVNNRMVLKRKQFYEAIIADRPSQNVFRRGWMRRAEEFLL